MQPNCVMLLMFVIEICFVIKSVVSFHIYVPFCGMYILVGSIADIGPSCFLTMTIKPIVPSIVTIYFVLAQCMHCINLFGETICLSSFKLHMYMNMNLMEGPLKTI